MTRRTRNVVAILAAASLVGCSASFKHRTAEYESPPLARPIRVGIHYSVYIPESFRAAAARAFAQDKSIEAVNAEKEPGPYDEEIRIDLGREVKSRTENFFVSWPGFLVFAPCWYEFRWNYVVRTRVAIIRADREPIVAEGVDKYNCAYTTVLDGVQSELGFVSWTSLALFMGLHNSIEDPNPIIFDKDFGKKEGDSWSRTLVAVTHQALAKAAEHGKGSPSFPPGGWLVPGSEARRSSSGEPSLPLAAVSAATSSGSPPS